MSAKIHVKGITCIGRSSGRSAVVFGDIVEGEAKKGMSLFIPFLFIKVVCSLLMSRDDREC